MFGLGAGEGELLAQNPEDMVRGKYGSSISSLKNPLEVAVAVEIWDWGDKGQRKG